MTDPNSRLKLQQFYFAFLIQIFGLLISCVQFMREKMHHYFEQQQNRVSVIAGKSQVSAAANVQVEIKQENNKVSVVIEKKERPNTRVNKKVEKGAKSVNIRQKRKNKISIISVVIGMKKKIEDIRV